jgi:hypothetical protein
LLNNPWLLDSGGLLDVPRQLDITGPQRPRELLRRPRELLSRPRLAGCGKLVRRRDLLARWASRVLLGMGVLLPGQVLLDSRRLLEAGVLLDSGTLLVGLRWRSRLERLLLRRLLRRGWRVRGSAVGQAVDRRLRHAAWWLTVSVLGVGPVSVLRAGPVPAGQRPGSVPVRRAVRLHAVLPGGAVVRRLVVPGAIRGRRAMPRGSGRGRLAARRLRHGLHRLHAGGLLRSLRLVRELRLMGCLRLLPCLLVALWLLAGARLLRLWLRRERLLDPW